ncbi:hypothetical protein Q5P01_008353 [Channa striata]|uniref:SPIN-DOC-like zinc-finger domain-containing protein n=1 Tax=Channa striata TaxID=64152 RepID=A0AA88NB46_CHASR|nr:hypothetical protein Q5P01_008353 [Channa striata]
MPTAKSKGGSTSHRYRPASEYDDATLAQKRAYWRTKKREQRARLSQRTRKPQDCLGEKPRHVNAPAVVSSTVSGIFAKDESHKTASVSLASQGRNARQTEKWAQTVKPGKVLPQLPETCSIAARADGGNAVTVKCLTARCAVNRPVTSATSSGTQMDTGVSVPAVRVTRLSNGSSAKATPQPRVSMQGPSFPKIQHKAQLAVRIQPKLLPTSVTTGMILVSSPCGPVSIKATSKTANTQSRTESALVTKQRAKGVEKAQPFLESEEEKAAKRREQWRIKKREQRAKLAARIAKARERTKGAEMAAQKQTMQKAGLPGDTGLQHVSSQSIFRGTGQKHCPARVKTLFTSAKSENDKLQGRAASSAEVSVQANQMKVQNTHGYRRAQTAMASDGISIKIPGDAHRKLPGHVHLANVCRGIARCKTPRQRFIEAHKILTNQRNARCKSPLYSGFGTRNIPKIDPNDTPEQVIAKRREYWRIKKREQRAKLSMEVKARLKEKDSLMRRVKRYQKILEDMRKARALAQEAGSALTSASEAIGGFIGEDGTVTANIPQGPAAHKLKEENHHIGANNSATFQPEAKLLCPAQVKVSFPLCGQLANKPPRLSSQQESATVATLHSAGIQSAGQLKLTHPQTPPNAISGARTDGSNLGGCVMKIARSGSVLTEEERMAKKREYWRIKKREQRAARAVRLKHGFLHARASAALQRRKAQKHVALMSAPLSRRLGGHPANVQPLCNSGPATPHTNEIKQENESVPAVDLHSKPEQAICPDIKPPTSLPTPPVPQPESVSESQATTLLAVASMKKLLEESLSTVSESKGEQADFKMETKEETLEAEIKPNVPKRFFGKDEVAPIAADLTLQIKSWQPDTDALSPPLKDSLHVGEALPHLTASNEVVVHSTCEHSSQTASNFIVNPSCEAAGGPPSPSTTQRLQTKKASHQNCCLEPPKLHHPPVDQVPPQQQRSQQPCQALVQKQNSTLLSASARYCSAMAEQCGLTSLQRKREYWKLMKRQQRARLKARQKETHEECGSRLSLRSNQARGSKDVGPTAKPAVQLKTPVASPTSLPSISTVLVTSPTASNSEQSPDTPQVTLPIASVSSSLRTERNSTNSGPPKASRCLRIPEGKQEAMAVSQNWMSTSTDVDSAPSPPTLKPPDNPLSSINLQPIEPPSQSSDSTQGPSMIPRAQLRSPTHAMAPPPKPATISTMIPPKPIPGESEEDFLRRKREYWRVKKKEQRARKAIRDKGMTPRRVSNTWRPILPAEDPHTQDSGQWVTSAEESDLVSTSVDADTGSFPCSNYTAPVEDETEVLFVEYENNDGEEGPASDSVWRTHYLMDYDPLNQLLVCMVCGDLQYSHSLEGVRAHIDEAHPETLTLEPGERRRMLEAWDEQVSQRERFFTSQLQQHSGSLEEAHRS